MIGGIYGRPVVVANLAHAGFVVFHGSCSANPRITVPYSYTRSDAGVELGWDVAAGHHLELSYFQL